MPFFWKNHKNRPCSAQPFPNSRTGFTLIELLITVAVLSIGCFAAIRMQATSLKSSNLADNITAATFLAEGEMERLKALSFVELTNETELSTVVVNKLNRLGQTCTTGACSNHIFTRTVNYYPSTPTTLSHQVEISVAWTDNTGPHSVLYSAAITSLSF
ncbi:MAG: prepilin-type N-terminal cleavage/methylation domain-containing protein [Deltaproteobacteria bacterium]|jgi:type IV pilus assembly protein PilV|nr:prepilin-type N-terminal cleavage/methylation domain-containing protein [Deltaproteobacteria bacterium]